MYVLTKKELQTKMSSIPQKKEEQVCRLVGEGAALEPVSASKNYENRLSCAALVKEAGAVSAVSSMISHDLSLGAAVLGTA